MRRFHVLGFLGAVAFLAAYAAPRPAAGLWQTKEGLERDLAGSRWEAAPGAAMPDQIVRLEFREHGRLWAESRGWAVPGWYYVESPGEVYCLLDITVNDVSDFTGSVDYSFGFSRLTISDPGVGRRVQLRRAR